jgi:hypothetical protein
MKSLTHLVNKTPRIVNNITKAIGFGLAGAVLYGTVSCASMTKAQKTALLGQGLSVLGSITMPGSNNKEGDRARKIMTISGEVITNQAQMQHDLEVAEAGRSQIVINNNPPNYQSQNQNYNSQDYNSLNNSENKDNSTPQGLFMYKNWVDFNNDRATNRNELIGLNEPVYDISNLNGLWFSFYGGRNRRYDGQNLYLKIYNLDDGKTINYFNEKYAGDSNIQDFPCKSMYFTKSGRYKAVLSADNNETFSLDFEVIK